MNYHMGTIDTRKETTRMVQVAKGLEGVVVADTALSEVDGEHGRLVYRGYEIADVANGASYEEVAFLLWEGHLPNRAELTAFRAHMSEHRQIPTDVTQVLRALPVGSDPMDVLRTASSA